MDRKVKFVEYGCGKMGKYLMRYGIEKGGELVGAFDMNPALIGLDVCEVIGDNYPEVGIKISDAKDAVDASKDADVDIEANIEVKFATMVLAYDGFVATVTGLDSSATYAWYLDNESSNIIPNGAACTVNTAKLSPGIHTLLVVATLDGKNYTEKCTITK